MSRVSASIPRNRLEGSLRRDSVRKHVAAIHISGKLTLLQRKLANVLLLNAYDHLISRPRHRIDARTLCLMVGYNSNDMETLKASLRALVETTAEWDMLGEDGEQEWGVSSLLSFAKMKGGICEYAYSPLLAEKLHDPKVFALINLDIQRRFVSGHGLALYENCYRFVRTGSTGWWGLDLFRRLMGIDESAYYTVFKQLNAKIIKPAVAEVNRNSNIFVTAEFRREGRSVVAVRFLIRENAQLAVAQPNSAETDTDRQGRADSAVYAALIERGVASRLARQWIAEHGEAYVAEKLSYVAARERAGAVRTSAVGYLSAAIAGDYGTRPQAVADPGLPEAVAQVLKAQADAELRESRLAEQRAASRRLRSARLARVLQAVEQRNATRRDADRRAFAGRLATDLERKDFQRYGWRSALCAQAIFAFWESMEPGLFDDIV